MPGNDKLMMPGKGFWISNLNKQANNDCSPRGQMMRPLVSILIIDDDPYLRQANVHLLKKAGYQVNEAGTGHYGLQLAKECKPDLILLDVVLPDIDGFEVCRRIKTDPTLTDSYVVLLSATRIDSDSQAEALEGGADGYIARPLSNRELLARIEALLRLKQAESHLRQRSLELGQRVKELDCLYGISTLLEKPGISREEILEGTLALVPPAWQYPEITCARVILEDRQFCTPYFRATRWHQARDIILHGQSIGRVEVHYLEERPPADEGPFLRNEGNLLAAIAGHLGRVIARIQGEIELRRANRALKALGEVNQALLRANVESELLVDICRIVVDIGGYHLAWVGLAEQDQAKQVRPVAQAGYEASYLESVNVTWDDSEHGQGPSGIAIRTGQPAIVRNIQTDPVYAPWRAEASQRGYASTIALPLLAADRPFAVLNIYAAEADAFDTEEVNLLADLAKNLAFGLMALRNRAERQRAEEQLRFQKTLLECQSEASLDGILVVAHDGEWLSYNQRFVEVWNVPLEFIKIGSRYEKLQWVMDNVLDPQQFMAKVKYLHEHPDEHSHDEVWLKDARILDRYSAPVMSEAGVYYGRVWYYRDVTVQKRAEEELRKREEEFRLIFEYSNDAIFWADLTTGRITNCNRKAEQLLEKTRAEIIGLHQTELHPPDEADVYQAKFSQAAAQQTSTDIEAELYTASGKRIPVLISASVVKIGDRTIMQGVFHDVTEIKRAEEQLRISNSAIESSINAIVISDLTGNLTYVNKAFLKLWGYEDEQEVLGQPATIFWQAEEKILEVIQVLQEKGGWIGELVAKRKNGNFFDVQLSASTVTNAVGEPIWLMSSFIDVTERKRAEEEISWLAKFPSENPHPVLRVKQDGTILYANKAGSPLLDSWACQGNQKIPAVWAKIVAEALSSDSIQQVEASLGDRILSLTFAPITDSDYVNIYGLDITWRKQAELALSESEARFRTIITQNVDGLVIVSRDGITRFVNPAAEAFFGFKAAELVGEQFGLPIVTDDAAELTVVSKYGETTIVEMRVVEIDWAGEINYLVLLRDVTERKRMEEVLGETEGRYRSLFENMKNAVAIFEAVDEGQDFIFKAFNRAGETIEQLKRVDLLGRSVQGVFPKIKEFGLFEVLQRVWQTGNPENFPVTFYQDERIAGWRENYVYKLPSGEVVTIYEDVTEKKRAEEAQQESEARFRRLTENAQDIIYRFRLLPQPGFEYVSPAATVITGYTPEEHYADPELGFKLIYPDDLPILQATAQSPYASGEPIVLRWMRKDGTIIWTEQRNVPIYDEAGRMIALEGIARDITERKLVEKDLRLKEMRLNSLLELSQKAHDLSEKEIIQLALEEAVKLTQSRIGYLHFLNSDQRTIQLFTWSKETLDICTAVYDSHYPLDKAGVWADCARLKQPVIHNDYQNLPNKKGYPLGHAHLIRHLSVPIVEEDRVEIIMGVGNKKIDYDDADVRQMLLTADHLWRIIRRKRAEAELRQSQASLANAQRIARLGNWDWDTRSNELRWSDEIYRLFGLQPHEFAATYEAFLNFVHPQDRKFVEQAINKALVRRQPLSFDHRLILPDESAELVVHLQAELVFDENERPIGLAGTLQDITERKQAEEELRQYRNHLEELVAARTAELTRMNERLQQQVAERQLAEAALQESKEHFRTVADFTYDWEYWLGEGGVLIYISPSCERISGYRPGEFQRDPELMQTIIHPDDQTRMAKHFEVEARNSEVITTDFRVITRSGEERWIGHVCQPVYGSGGRWLGRRASNRDITEQKQMQLQLQEYAQHLEQLVTDKVRELELERAKTIQAAKMAALGEMATGVAHELNQPLTSMLFEADYLKKIAQRAGVESTSSLRLNAEEVGQIGENLAQDIARCRRIIDHLRAFGRVSADYVSSVNLNKPIEDSFILIGERLKQHGVTVQLQLTPQLPLILADTHKLEQVFLNLFSNAEDALEEMERRVKSGALISSEFKKTIEISTGVEGEFVTAVVRDNGCGIPTSAQEHLFEPFFTTKSVGQGTGLGLTISYGIVTEFSGEILFESAENKGTTFILRFPAAVKCKT
jgi:PAS domain S-box-containing protein